MFFLSLFYIHIKFRIYQIVRILTLNPKVGVYSLFISIAILGVNLPSSYFLVLFLTYVFIFHFNRRDIAFLKIIFHKNWRLAVFLENLILFEILAFLKINNDIKEILIAIIFIALISFLIKPINKKFMLSWNILSDSLFEWRSYLRKNTILILLFYPLFITTAFNNTTLILGGLFIMDPIIHVFKYNESKEMLELFFYKISLKEKLKKNILFFNISLSPLYVLFFILNFNYFYVILYYIIFMNLFHLLIITRKYELFVHNKQLTNYNYIETYYQYMISAMLVIPAIYSINKKYKLSLKNIKSYVRNSKY